MRPHRFPFMWQFNSNLSLNPRLRKKSSRYKPPSEHISNSRMVIIEPYGSPFCLPFDNGFPLVPSLFDPHVDMDLSQHLFDIQMGMFVLCPGLRRLICY
jgi:hypothetical protein